MSCIFHYVLTLSRTSRTLDQENNQIIIDNRAALHGASQFSLTLKKKKKIKSWWLDICSTNEPQNKHVFLHVKNKFLVQGICAALKLFIIMLFCHILP